MTIPRLSLATLSLLFCLSPFVAVAKTAKSAAPGSFKSAIVVDAESGAVLSETNADLVSPPASMTKLMTFAVLADQLAAGKLTLQTPVRVEPSDAGLGGTQVYLDPRETFSVEELLYAMMIQSANDAAHALARATAGSTEAFVQLMNEKARALGMTHTTFRSPHGLPPTSRRNADGDLTTARDYARLCRYLVGSTDVLKYSSVSKRDFAPARKNGPLRMENHNKLLGRITGVDGLKTGYTQSAGYCLSATAERNGRRVIVVIMGAFGPNGEIDKGRFRDLKAIELLNQGFAALPAGLPTVRTGAVAAGATSKSPASAVAPAPAPAAAGEKPMFTFRVIPPEKKP